MCLLPLQDRLVYPDQDFPEIHLGQTGSHGYDHFDISPGHGRLYLPEAMVLKVEMEMMRKAKDGKQKELDDRANPIPKPEEQQKENEEGIAAGTGDYLLDDPLPLLGPNQSVRQAFSEQRIEREREELEKMRRERDFKRQHSKDQELTQVIEGIKCSEIEDDYVHVTTHNGVSSQYSADQQPSAADRLREEHSASTTSPSMGRKCDGTSHPPHYRPNEVLQTTLHNMTMAATDTNLELINHKNSPCIHQVVTQHNQLLLVTPPTLPSVHWYRLSHTREGLFMEP